jgi:uncharacterized damage-inducible protein DinB
MTMNCGIDDLLAYSDWDRGQWQAWFGDQGADAARALAVDLGPHNDNPRVRNVGELIRHIFSAEQRYVERSLERPLSDRSSIPADDVEALFAFGDESRRSLRELLAILPDEQWTALREMSFGSHTRMLTPRAFVLQAVTHEIRHWAHVAAFLRQAGFKPGVHDLIACPAFHPAKP